MREQEEASNMLVGKVRREADDIMHEARSIPVEARATNKEAADLIIAERVKSNESLRRERQ